MASEQSLEKAKEIGCWLYGTDEDFTEGTRRTLIDKIAAALDEQVRKDAGIAYDNNDSCNCANCNKRFNIQQAILSQLQPKKGEKI